MRSPSPPRAAAPNLTAEEASAALLAMLARPPVHEQIRRALADAMANDASSHQIDAQLADLPILQGPVPGQEFQTLAGAHHEPAR